MCVYACMLACMHACMYVSMCMNVYVHISICMYRYVHVCVYIYIYIRLFCAYIYVYTFTLEEVIDKGQLCPQPNIIRQCIAKTWAQLQHTLSFSLPCVCCLHVTKCLFRFQLQHEPLDSCQSRFLCFMVARAGFWNTATNTQRSDERAPCRG